MTAPPAVRYSTPKVATSQTAQSFPWESPVPVNRFWDSISYCVSGNFLDNFFPEELARLPIDPDSDAPNEDKYVLLLRLLRVKLEREEAAAAPRALHEVDYKRWNGLVQGIYTMQEELGQAEAEDTLRLLVDKREESNIVPLHMLADHLVLKGKYAEAVEIERGVCVWMDKHEHLGRDSPQAINSRRIIARALWGQGASRRGEAEAMVAEIRGIIDGMGDGKFGVYQDMEKDLTDKMVAELETSH